MGVDNPVILTVYLAHGGMLPFRVFHAITEDLTFKDWQLHCMLQYLLSTDSRALSHCKHEMGAFSWLNGEPLERVPSPYF